MLEEGKHVVDRFVFNMTNNLSMARPNLYEVVDRFVFNMTNNYKHICKVPP